MGHVKHIPTTQFYIEIPRNTQSKSLTEYAYQLLNNELWDDALYIAVIDSLVFTVASNDLSNHGKIYMYMYLL